MCASLRRHPRGRAITRILAASLQAVEPGAAVARHMQRDGEALSIGDKIYHLDEIRHVYLVGFGKAAVPMGLSASTILGEYLHQGLLITKTGQALPLPGAIAHRLVVVEAGHPIPDESSLQASLRLNTLLHAVHPQDLVICLISGGGSALITMPVDGVSLAELQALTSQLLACGASISEINVLRKHLEQLKGGRLAQRAAPAALVGLVLSDVIGDRLEVIASGPTVADSTTFGDALDILRHYNLVDTTPPAIQQYLKDGAAGRQPETPKPGEAAFANVYNLVTGSNLQAAQAALQQARNEGMDAQLLTTSLQGEARQAGRFLASLASELTLGRGPVRRPGCLILGGETTVIVTGGGFGGRNQELALGAVADLAGLSDILLVTLATDGGDGPTDAAGAVASGETLERARSLGLDPRTYLQQNDSYHFFQALDDLLKPGPTQTNVNDLAFVFAF